MNHYESLAHSLYEISPAWSTRMHSAGFLLPRAWRDWLLNKHSLSARLFASEAGEYRVKPLYEGFGRAFLSEKSWVGEVAKVFWCREVCLYLGSTPVVYARTLIPLRAPNPQLYAIRHLATKPLGEYLFQHPNLERGAINVNPCPINDLGLSFCRRSSFKLSNQRVFIAEGFCESLLNLAH